MKLKLELAGSIDQCLCHDETVNVVRTQVDRAIMKQNKIEMAVVHAALSLGRQGLKGFKRNVDKARLARAVVKHYLHSTLTRAFANWASYTSMRIHKACQDKQAHLHWADSVKRCVFRHVSYQINQGRRYTR